ncbi:hypothetical protein, partial [Alkalicoccobacillus porphyridii]|uniref:hypothetical protein n=1 Tax=Alkalicoccobacillus porphyridii TaxID=2597270 RepID=UPI001C8F55F2
LLSAGGALYRRGGLSYRREELFIGAEDQERIMSRPLSICSKTKKAWCAGTMLHTVVKLTGSIDIIFLL